MHARIGNKSKTPLFILLLACFFTVTLFVLFHVKYASDYLIMVESTTQGQHSNTSKHDVHQKLDWAKAKFAKEKPKSTRTENTTNQNNENIASIENEIETPLSTRPTQVQASSINTKIEKTMEGNAKKFLVKTKSCKIPDLDPHDLVLKDIIYKGEEIICNESLPLTYQDSDTVYINWTAVNQSALAGIIEWCVYWPIVRPVSTTSDHNSVKYLDQSEIFMNKIKVTEHEFVRVHCYNKSVHPVFVNFHSFVVEKQDVEDRCERNWKKRHASTDAPEEDLNVMIVGLDSVSRLNSIRFLKKTRTFLLEDLNAVELLGQNIVGDATFVNMVPLLTGKYPEELPWVEGNTTNFDKFSFIWKNFSENGYRTIYLEDHPWGSIFDYLRPGFRETPTDYYDRHFQLTTIAELYNWNHCLHDKTATDLVLNHTYRIASKLRHKPFFSFVFLTTETHDVLEKTAAVDEKHLNFLQNLEKENILNNTILIYLSDHGIRYGYIRNFYNGKIEERLPMTFVRLPGWFSKKYPDVMKNLQVNARRLSTKFDLYETLLDILYFKRERKDSIHSRGYSMLRNLPKDRSCSDASIEDHWCTCSDFKSIDVNNSSIRKAAAFLILVINSKLIPVSHLCHTYHLANVTSAYDVISNSEDLNKSFKSYQLTVVVHPGDAIFEASVRIQESGAMSLLGDISRINSYRHQDRCDVGKYLERICYCLSNKR